MHLMRESLIPVHLVGSSLVYLRRKYITMRLRSIFLFGLLIGAAFFAQLYAVQAQPALANNRILDLDGTDGTYVELPPNMINHLKNLTVEGWVRWRSFGNWSRFFDFGNTKKGIRVTQLMRTQVLNLEVESAGGFNQNEVPNYSLQPDQWNHIAVVASADGFKLYFNVVLTGTNSQNINKLLTANNSNVVES